MSALDLSLCPSPALRQGCHRCPAPEEDRNSTSLAKFPRWLSSPSNCSTERATAVRIQPMCSSHEKWLGSPELGKLVLEQLHHERQPLNYECSFSSVFHKMGIFPKHSRQNVVILLIKNTNLALAAQSVSCSLLLYSQAGKKRP